MSTKATEITPEHFAEICYLALMSGGSNGLVSKHPSYIEEKKYVLEMGYGAFAALDIHNQKVVVAWLRNWGFVEPKVVQEVHEAELAAYQELKEKGYDI